QGAQALDALAKLPADGQAGAVSRLGAPGRARLAGALQPGQLSPPRKTGRQAGFDAPPHREGGTPELPLGPPLQQHLGAASQDGADWDAPGLRRTWSLLESLPPAAVEQNPKFSNLLRYKDSDANQTHGYYQEGSNEVAMSYGGAQLDRGLKSDVVQGQQLYD